MAFFSLLIAYYVIFYCSSFSPIFFLSHPLSVHIFHHIDRQLEVARMNGEKNDCNFSLKWFQTIIRKILKDHYNCTIFIFFFKRKKITSSKWFTRERKKLMVWRIFFCRNNQYPFYSQIKTTYKFFIINWIGVFLLLLLYTFIHHQLNHFQITLILICLFRVCVRAQQKVNAKWYWH